MLQKIISKIFLLTLISFCSLVSLAQSNVCDLKIKTQLFDSKELVKGATATAESIEQKTLYKSVEKDGMPYFESLPEGQYKIIVVKDGYKQTILKPFHECNLKQDTKFEEKLFFVWKGDSKEIAEIPIPKGEFIIDANSVPVGNRSGGSGITTTGKIDESGYLSKGVLNYSAVKLSKPEYPKAARYVKASGAVNVQVLIDEEGNVVSAEVVSGHPFFHQTCVKAALESKFKPTLLDGKPVKVSGIIVYNFVP